MLDLALAKSLCPRHPLIQHPTWSRVLSLRKSSRFLPFGFVPVVPTVGPHHVAHLGRYKRDRRVIAPGPAEIRLHAGRAGDLAIPKHKPELLVLRSRRGRNVAVPQTMDLAF